MAAFLCSSNYFLYPQQSDTVKRLTAVGHDYANWSPDNKNVIFTAGYTGRWQVYIRNIITKVAKRLTGNDGNDDFPAYSPDAKSIVYLSEIKDTQTIGIMNANGSDQKKLTNHHE